MEAEEEDQNQMELLCRLIPLRQTYTLWFLLASHVFFAITAILGKRLITAAVYRASSLHPPSKTLLRSLALTDLFVGLLVDSIFIVFLITLDSKCSEICVSFFKISYSTSQILSSVSLSVLTAISVDRLYALILGLRYRQIVTLKRVGLLLVFSWTQGIAFGLAVFINPRIAPYSSLVGIAICLLTSVCCYTKIYKRLRHQHTQIQVLQLNILHGPSINPEERLNMARYRKTVSTCLWILLTLVVCYLPLMVVSALIVFKTMTSSLAFACTFSATLVNLNSTLNPFLYCWKIRDVRRAVIDTVREVFSRCSN